MVEFEDSENIQKSFGYPDLEQIEKSKNKRRNIMYQKNIENDDSKKQEYPETELIKLTGLWEGKTKSGKTYYSGKAEDGTKYMLFHNEYWSESNNQPNLNLCISREK